MACNLKTEVYSRIVGYYRPVQQWNKGKLAEYTNRKTYKFSMSKVKKFGDHENVVISPEVRDTL